MIIGSLLGGIGGKLVMGLVLAGLAAYCQIDRKRELKKKDLEIKQLRTQMANERVRTHRAYQRARAQDRKGQEIERLRRERDAGVDISHDAILDAVRDFYKK